ncbi:MAG TPA: PC4/YdbC family ssDNA-binding protein [Thermotogota bacterium]|nr:PC4/YdbC family ssDNA-binding protein [Thermotogota bacterium]
MADIKFEIIEKIGVISEGSKGWNLELNKVSWNQHPAKYDIREWSPDHQRMSKGVTLTGEQAKALRELLHKEAL